MLIRVISFPNSSGTMHVINWKRYALVPWVESIQRILWLYFSNNSCWNCVWMTNTKPSVGKLGYAVLLSPCGLKSNIGSYTSCCSSATRSDTDIGSLLCLMIALSLMLTRTFEMSCLVIKCFREAHWSNKSLLLRWPTSWRISTNLCKHIH